LTGSYGILITQRQYAEVEDAIEVEPVGEFTLKGFQRPIAAFDVLGVRKTAADPSQMGSHQPV
jgi:class 3 adenylate cyclase